MTMLGEPRRWIVIFDLMFDPCSSSSALPLSLWSPRKWEGEQSTATSKKTHTRWDQNVLAIVNLFHLRHADKVRAPHVLLIDKAKLTTGVVLIFPHDPTKKAPSPKLPRTICGTPMYRGTLAKIGWNTPFSGYTAWVNFA